MSISFDTVSSLMTGKELFLNGTIKRTLLTNAVPTPGGIRLLAINSVADGLSVSKLLGERALAGLTLASLFIIAQSSLTTRAAPGSSVLINRGPVVVNPLSNKWTFADTIQTRALSQRNSFSTPFRSFNLNVAYRFGKLKMKSPAQCGIHTDDLKEITK